MGSFNLLLEDGGGLLLETGGFDNLLLESAPDVVPMLVLFKTTKLNPNPVDEETTPLYTAKLVDEDGLAVESGVLDAFLLTVFDKTTETILRENQDVLNTNDVTITYGDDTLFEWSVQVNDTKLVTLDKTSQKHVALFEYAWDADYSGTATDPFSTTSGSASVTVTLPSHGLTGEDNHLFFVDAEGVGGLCFQGSQAVEVVDSNTLTITGRKNATSTDSGGGSLTYFANPQVLKHVVEFTVKRREPIC